MRESFVFFQSYHEAISVMPPEIQLEIYNTICRYALYGEIPEMSNTTKAMFTLMKANLDATEKKYREAVENGKRGGRPKKAETQTDRKPPLYEIKTDENPPLCKIKTDENPPLCETKTDENLNVNDNVTDNVNNNDAVNVTATATVNTAPAEFFEEAEEEETNTTEQTENTGEEPVEVLPLSVGGSHPVYQKDVDYWLSVYPNLRITDELRRMKAWLEANPDRLKSRKEIKRFIVNWFNNALEKPQKNDGDNFRDHAKKQPQANPPGFDTDEFWKNAIARSQEIMEELDRENSKRE